MADAEPPWASASELAEYAYCPRAWYYRAHPPDEGPSEESLRAARAGERYHRETLHAELRQERAGRAYVAAAVLAALLIAGGLAWLWLR